MVREPEIALSGELLEQLLEPLIVKSDLAAAGVADKVMMMLLEPVAEFDEMKPDHVGDANFDEQVDGAVDRGFIDGASEMKRQFMFGAGSEGIEGEVDLIARSGAAAADSGQVSVKFFD